jgi:hypothetical protein
MIVVDTSGLPLPGQEAAMIAVVKEVAAHLDQRWPLPAPRQVTVDVTGETGRVHLLSVKESLAEHERQVVEQAADETYRALLQKAAPLGVPGSTRTVLRRIV